MFTLHVLISRTNKKDDNDYGRHCCEPHGLQQGCGHDVLFQ